MVRISERDVDELYSCPGRRRPRRPERVRLRRRVHDVAEALHGNRRLLEFLPETDPSAARASGALSMRLLFRGRPLANAHVHAGVAYEGAPKDSAKAPKDLALVTDADGRIIVPLAHGGLWNVRTLHAAPAEAGTSATWDVHFATLTFRVSGGSAHAH